MLKNKNDYSVIVFFEDGAKPKKWKFVHSLFSFSKFLDKEHPSWDYMNVYIRRSGDFLKRYKRGQYVPNKPQP